MLLKKKKRRQRKRNKNLLHQWKKCKRTDNRKIVIFFCCDNFMYHEMFNGGNLLAVARLEIVKRVLPNVVNSPTLLKVINCNRQFWSNVSYCVLFLLETVIMYLSIEDLLIKVLKCLTLLKFSICIPPKNVRKLKVFWHFQGGAEV